MIDTRTLSLMLIFLGTSAISVITGSTSLITVPAMLQFGIDPKAAVATNMLALVMMSVGGSLPFLQRKLVDRRRLPWILLLTIAGSIWGANLLIVLPQSAVSVVIAGAMLGIALFSSIYRQSEVHPRGRRSRWAEITGFVLTFVLGIYGGFFSGGYVTLLTAVYLVCFRMTYLEAIAVTKVANIFSSAASTLIFVRHGLIDYRLGVLLGSTMFLGALVGSRFAIRIGEVWIRRIYLVVICILGLKTLLFDVFTKQHAQHSCARGSAQSFCSNVAQFGNNSMDEFNRLPQFGDGQPGLF